LVCVIFSLLYRSLLPAFQPFDDAFQPVGFVEGTGLPSFFIQYPVCFTGIPLVYFAVRSKTEDCLKTSRNLFDNQLSFFVAVFAVAIFAGTFGAKHIFN